MTTTRPLPFASWPARPPVRRCVRWRWGLSVLVVALVVALAGCRKDSTDFASEGTFLAPMDLGDASAQTVTHEGVVGVEGSYYSVTVDNSTQYDVAITRLSADADLFVYDGVIGPASTVRCASVNAGTASERCPISNSLPGLVAFTGTFIIHVKHAGDTGTHFTLTIAPR